MKKISEIIETIGMKKICLFAHYGLAIGISLIFFLLCIIATFLPGVYDVKALFDIYKLVLVYCGIVVAYITIVCIFDSLQTMNKAKSKFDFIAFFIGFSLFTTLALIIVCIVFMFIKTLTDIELNMWKHLIAVFGGMFMTEAGGGYIYNIFKKKFAITEQDKKTTEEQSVEQNAG